MSTVTEPILLNSTGVRIAEALEGLYIGKRLLVNINNYSYGTVTGAGAYPSGQTVTLTAIPADGCGFLAWKDANGNVLSTELTYTFTILNDTVIQADFIDEEDVEIVAWSTGDITKINKMISAAYAGKLDLSDYWSVGDARTLHHEAIVATELGLEAQPAQDVEWVLMSFDCTGFKLTSDTDVEPQVIVGMKNCLTNRGKLSLAEAPWRDCARRTWGDTLFKESIPQNERLMFKQFSWSVATATDNYAFPPLVSMNDYFAFPLFKNVFGDFWIQQAYSAEDELYSRWEYYTTTENRIKHYGNTVIEWFLSSNAVANGYKKKPGAVSETGEPSEYGISFDENHGVSFFGCI